VKHITVSVPDDVDEFARLEALQHEVLAEIRQFRAADRLDRDEAHDRGDGQDYAGVRVTNPFR
jgi:hypothetical protein